MSEHPVEQITKEPQEKVEKVKDPKKVAAGKRLAEYHKKAKQALKESEEKSSADADGSWLPEISFSTVIGIVGIGLTATDLYFRFRKSDKPSTTQKYKPKLEPIKEGEPPKKKIGME